MEAILAGRGDYAIALADLGFTRRSYQHSLHNGRANDRLDEYSGNARMVKAAMCAGILLTT